MLIETVKKRYVLLPIFCLLWFAFYGNAQVTNIQGKVTDAATGEPIPFASVYLNGLSVATQTNVAGRYTISSASRADSITFSYVGYKSITKAILPFAAQVMDVKMEVYAAGLQEIVIRAKNNKNPAHAIIEKVIANRPLHDKMYLQAYEYESYSKVELKISHLPSSLKRQKVIQSIYSLLDTSGFANGKNNQLPVFISETLSQVYYNAQPPVRKEEVIRSNIKGIGFEQSEIIAQMLGSGLQDYNFYEDWLNFLERKIVSPIGHSWKFYYNYELTDSAFVDGDFCYKIDIEPKREQDLAFAGSLWITKKESALKQFKGRIDKKANLNFVDELQIDQRLLRTKAGYWLPEKTYVILAGQPFHHTDAGFLVKHSTSIKRVIVNKPRSSAFYTQPKDSISLIADVNPDFWRNRRHDTLSASEMQVMQMIDSVNTKPKVKRLVAVLRTIGSGYLRLGKVDIGPIPLFYIRNNVEQNRIGLGLKTNQQLFNNVQLAPFIAYGTGDQRFKYNFTGTYLLSRSKWTVFKLDLNKDVEQVSLDPDDVRANYFFYASSKWGKLDYPYLYTNNGLSLEHDFWKGVTFTGHLKLRGFDPLYPFFYYPVSENHDGNVISDFRTAEIGAKVRLSKNENFILTNYSRVSARNSKWPVLTLSYNYGLKGILGGDFDFHKLEVKAEQRIKLGVAGISRYTLEGGTLLHAVPYPLLYVHTGNESFFYTAAAYSLMNYMEFVSDRFVSLRYQHNFDGFILNSIPGISKLNWRLLVQGNILYGSLRGNNKTALEISKMAGGYQESLGALNKGPYLELGYGIENIFRFIRVDAFHRITYRNAPEVRTFGLKASAQFKF